MRGLSLYRLALFFGQLLVVSHFCNKVCDNAERFGD
jgi:hypothetical protein